MHFFMDEQQCIEIDSRELCANKKPFSPTTLDIDYVFSLIGHLIIKATVFPVHHNCDATAFKGMWFEYPTISQ